MAKLLRLTTPAKLNLMLHITGRRDDGYHLLETLMAPISLYDLEKRYPDFRLGPLALEIEPGTVVGLVGPNGAGKTTTLNCITGLVAADAGLAEVFGSPNWPGEPAWKRHIGYVGEEHGFYARWTAERNLRAIGARAIRSLRFAASRGAHHRDVARPRADDRLCRANGGSRRGYTGWRRQL